VLFGRICREHYDLTFALAIGCTSVNMTKVNVSFERICLGNLCISGKCVSVHNSWLTNFWVTAGLNQFLEEKTKLKIIKKSRLKKRLERYQHVPRSI